MSWKAVTLLERSVELKLVRVLPGSQSGVVIKVRGKTIGSPWLAGMVHPLSNVMVNNSFVRELVSKGTVPPTYRDLRKQSHIPPPSNLHTKRVRLNHILPDRNILWIRATRKIDYHVGGQ